MKKLLIIEDEEIMRKILAERFIKDGFEVVLARDGQIGLEQAFAVQPDFILLDIIMPKMDGMEVLAKIRADGAWGQQVPIMILTNLSIDAEVIKKMEQYKFVHHMVKTDWTLDQIADKVDGMMKEFKPEN